MPETIRIPVWIILTSGAGIIAFLCLMIFIAYNIGCARAEKAMTEERVSAKMERKYGALLAEYKTMKEERKHLLLANGEMHRKILEAKTALG